MRTAGLVIVLGVLAGVVVAGLVSPDGTAIVSPAGDMARAVWSSLRHGWGEVHVNVRGVAGNGPVAGVIGLGLFAALVVFVQPARAGRGMAVAAVAAVTVGLLLYSPALLGGAA